jgi:ribulose kinase
MTIDIEKVRGLSPIHKRNTVLMLLLCLCNKDVGIITDSEQYENDGTFEMTVTINNQEINPELFLETVYAEISNKSQEIEKFKSHWKSNNSSNAKLEKALKQLDSVKNQMQNVESLLSELKESANEKE